MFRICIVLALFVAGVSAFGNEKNEGVNYKEFISFVESVYEHDTVANRDGLPYQRVIPLRFDQAKTCLIGIKANDAALKSIFNFYKLLVEELNTYRLKKLFTYPVQAIDVEDCPEDTDIYIYLYGRGPGSRVLSGIKNQIDLMVKRHELLPPRKDPDIKAMGQFSFHTNKDSDILKTFIAINIKSSSNALKDDEKRLIRLAVVQELYQAFTLGYNTYISSAIYSNAHEPKYLQEDIYANQVKPSDVDTNFKYRAIGLCGFDLWYLIFAYGVSYNETEIRSFTTMDKFIELFNDEIDEVVSKANTISDNPSYKDIIEARCSLENTGVYSKIPIYRNFSLQDDLGASGLGSN